MHISKWEYQLQSVFDSNCKVCGLKWQSYPAIVGGGNRSAVLHYVDNNRKIPSSPESNLLLIDAGADYLGYATDITRTYPGNGKFTHDQKIIYQAVLDAQKAAIATLKVGSNWAAATAASIRAMLVGLKKGEVVVGDVDQMIAAGVNRLFFLHSLGHNLGLNVHDSGPLGVLLEKYFHFTHM